MSFLTNKDSASYTRYSYGVTDLQHKGVTTTTSVGSRYDDFLLDLENTPSQEGRVPSYCANRPDTISDIFYDSPGYWWYVMQYNGTFDPFESLGAGYRIFIPDLM